MPLRLAPALALALLIGLAVPRAAAALPHNARQTAEGYWTGGMPEPDDIDALYAAGVRLVVSSVEPPVAVLERCEELGMTQVYLRMGATFRDPWALLEATEGWPASQIYLHCDHGGDRAGAMLALLLVVREGWAPDHALLAVAYPGGGNVSAMIRLMEARGLRVTADERRRYAGLYSGRSTGGTGGLKAIGERYENLVVTTLEAFERVGVELDE